MGAFLGRKVLKLATGSSRPHDANPPVDITQLNSSVWRFCSPPVPDVDIIFFHGLQLGDFEDAFWKTWQGRNDSKVVWPKEWLSKRFLNARILSISYNSSATRGEGQLDMYALGENLVSDMIINSNIDIGQNRPVFLVGHSLGGIVIKQFILSALKMLGLKVGGNNQEDTISRIRTFLESFKGVFYYSTPHEGSRVADSTLTEIVSNLADTSPILELLKTLNGKRQRINDRFRRHQRKVNSRSFALVEGRETTYKGVDRRILEYSSATQFVDDSYTDTTADHFTVCKATDVNDSTVIGKLANFIHLAGPEILYVPPVIDGEPNSSLQ